MQRPGRLDRALGVVREQRRDLQRDPAVHAVGALVHPEEGIGRAPQVIDGQVEEQVLARQPGPCLGGDRLVVVARADGLVEDRGVRGQAGHRVGVDVVLDRA